MTQQFITKTYMKKILITGATGNVGERVIHFLKNNRQGFEILACYRSEKDKARLSKITDITPVFFDFEEIASIELAINQCHVLFLLRPPHLTDIKKYFEPITHLAKKSGLEQIVFLSVQGAESSTLIPHHKIERLIVESGINFTFLRPAYFMQNFTTTLKRDILEKDEIFLPAGNAKFTLIDLNDVGKVAATILTNNELHINQAYTLTNQEQLTFQQMAAVLSEELGRKISFKSPNLVNFFIQKRREKVPTAFILVMIMLHYLPRFSSTPPTTDTVEKLIESKPIDFREFVKRETSNLKSPSS
jgi:uncharacterized protein YbjT (DUF2867 family)